MHRVRPARVREPGRSRRRGASLLPRVKYPARKFGKHTDTRRTATRGRTDLPTWVRSAPDGSSLGVWIAGREAGTRRRKLRRQPTYTGNKGELCHFEKRDWSRFTRNTTWCDVFMNAAPCPVLLTLRSPWPKLFSNLKGAGGPPKSIQLKTTTNNTRTHNTRHPRHTLPFVGGAGGTLNSPPRGVLVEFRSPARLLLERRAQCVSRVV